MTTITQKGQFGFGLQYTKYIDGTVVAAKAQGKIVFTANPSNADAVTIGAKTYTFKTSITTANDILIGTTASATASNLAAAIVAGAGIGTLYGTGTTANATVSAVAQNQTVYLTVILVGSTGNSTVLTSVAVALTLTAFAGGLTAGTFDPTLIPWHKHRAREITYDATNVQSILPPEVGDDITPVGAYKSGVAMSGGASILPRMESDMGVLLLAALGSASTATSTPEAGANTHTFKLNNLNQDDVPWLAVRKAIPGQGALGRGKGVTGYDNKVGLLRFTVPQAAPIEARLEVVGRIPKFDDHPDSWLYTDGYEDFKSLPIACKGNFSLPTVTANPLPVTQVVVELMNMTTGPREEFIVGSYFMDDIQIRQRALSVRFLYKWYDPTFYDYSMGNALNITDWQPQPFVTTKSGGSYAFELNMVAPFVIGSTATPYSLKIRATKCYWEPMGEPVLQGGGIIMQEFRGTVLKPDTSTDPYAEFILVNAASAYTVPAAP